MNGTPVLHLVGGELVADDTREERGVIQDRCAPAGYVGYMAVGEDGNMVAHLIVRREVVESLQQHCVDELWGVLREYESRMPSPVHLA